jgi:hypothetical protein
MKPLAKRWDGRRNVKIIGKDTEKNTKKIEKKRRVKKVSVTGRTPSLQ